MVNTAAAETSRLTTERIFAFRTGRDCNGNRNYKEMLHRTRHNGGMISVGISSRQVPSYVGDSRRGSSLRETGIRSDFRRNVLFTLFDGADKDRQQPVMD